MLIFIYNIALNSLYLILRIFLYYGQIESFIMNQNTVGSLTINFNIDQL